MGWADVQAAAAVKVAVAAVRAVAPVGAADAVAASVSNRLYTRLELRAAPTMGAALNSN